MKVNIANGASVSEGIPLRPGQAITGIFMPPAWTAANLSLEGSIDGNAWAPLYDASGQQLVVVAAAARLIVIDEAATQGIPNVRLRSGTEAAPVNQGAARVIGVEVAP